MSMKITLIPKGTVIYEPDPIHRVTLQFHTEDDAIVFFEWCKQLGTTQVEESQTLLLKKLAMAFVLTVTRLVEERCTRLESEE